MDEEDENNISTSETNVRENRWGNQDWTIEKHRQNWVHNTVRIQDFQNWQIEHPYFSNKES